MAPSTTRQEAPKGNGTGYDIVKRTCGTDRDMRDTGRRYPLGRKSSPPSTTKSSTLAIFNSVRGKPTRTEASGTNPSPGLRPLVVYNTRGEGDDDVVVCLQQTTTPHRNQTSMRSTDQHTTLPCSCTSLCALRSRPSSIARPRHIRHHTQDKPPP